MAVLRIGILGVARIARGFVEGVRASPRVEVVAVASRDAARAAAFAAEFAVARAHGSYEALLDDAGVDAVYNPLPNGLHARWSIAAAAAGKHVLCEKPLAVTEADGRAMFAAAAAAGVQLLEAFPFHFQPQTLEMLRLIAGEAIGEVRVVQATFAFNIPDAVEHRFDPRLGGGALLDVGCYPVSLARLAFGRRPVAASAAAEWTESGVDRALAGTLEIAGGGTAQISASFAAAGHRHALIAGSRGIIETGYRNHTDRDEPVLRVQRSVLRDEAVETVVLPRANGFRLEAEALAALVERPDPAAIAAHTAASLDTLAAMDALLESARTQRRVAIPAASVE